MRRIVAVAAAAATLVLATALPASAGLQDDLKKVGDEMTALRGRVGDVREQRTDLVNQILADFKAGTRDVAEFWIDMGDKKVHIRYWPVRAPNGAYLGCLEAVQDIAPLQKIQGEVCDGSYHLFH